MKPAGVGGFVPGPHPVAPAPAAINLGQRFPEGEHAVETRKIEGAHLLGRAYCAVMRVVEQQAEAATALARRSQPRDQSRIVPLVNDHQIGIGSQFGRIGILAIDRGRETRIAFAPRSETFVAVIAKQILQAPRALRFKGFHRVPAHRQLVEQSTQEMRIAVIPARLQRMGEIGDLHAATSWAASAAW